MIHNQNLVNMAGDASRTSREALVSATAEQFLNNADAATLLERTLFSDILVKLYGFARQEIRQKLSAALAMADWAPIALVRELALDTIDIAQPVISFSPVLNDDVLIEVVTAGDTDIRICVADRPGIGNAVSRKLIGTNNARVISQLAKNVTARIQFEDFQRAMEVLGENQDDVDALVGRHDLPVCLIATAYALASAQTRMTISMRLPPKLDQRLARLTEFIAADAAEGRISKASATDNRDVARAAAATTDKTPTPGTLLAALMRGERQTFIAGMSKLLGFPDDLIARKLVAPRPETIGMLARSANFDATIVRTMYETLDKTSTPWSATNDREVAMLWMRYSPSTARLSLGKNACR